MMEWERERSIQIQKHLLSVVRKNLIFWACKHMKWKYYLGGWICEPYSAWYYPKWWKEAAANKNFRGRKHYFLIHGESFVSKISHSHQKVKQLSWSMAQRLITYVWHVSWHTGKLHGRWPSFLFSGRGGEEKETEEILLWAHFQSWCPTHRTFSTNMDTRSGTQTSVSICILVPVSIVKSMIFWSKGNLWETTYFWISSFIVTTPPSSTCSWYHFYVMSGVYILWRQVYNIMLKPGASKSLSA